MTTKRMKARQKEFLQRCATSTQALEDIFQDMELSYETFVTWMGQRDFKSRLHGLRRFLSKVRDLQLDVASYRASRLMAHGTSVSVRESATKDTRQICVDVIRLARDSRVRQRTQQAELIGRDRQLSHPDLPQEEVDRLMRELDASAMTQPMRRALSSEPADGPKTPE